MTINIPSFKIPTWLKFSLLIGLGISIVLLMRGGCGQGKLTVAEAVQFKNDIKRLVQDSARLAKERDSTKKAYQDSLDFTNGQLALKNNQLLSTRLSLDSADKRITILINKHQDIQPSKDTTFTKVPNEFVNDCHDCFTELEGGQQKVKLYLSQLDSVKAEAQRKFILQQNRINQLDKQNTQLAGTLQDCIEISKTAEKKLAPHGQLFFSWSVLWVPYTPTMAGMGLMYQSKRKLQIGVRGMFGNYGSGFETEVNMPLSSKRK